ncbi:MAG: glycosyltransferase [Cyclobacteriaceae bacterium]|nr:glycosyltransferase [Cyclobacteriaceae bacterium]
MSEISAVIITFNEAHNITRCIESVRSIADEILVVDSFSTDNTRLVCEALGARVIEHKFKSHIDQKNYAVSQAQYDLVLSLDADEYLSEELTESILAIKNSWPYQAYSMNRLSNYGGKWIRHGNWYPDKKIRLWNRKVGLWGGENPHDKVIIDSGVKVLHLEGDILHRAYNTSAEALAKVQNYSQIFANVNESRKSSSVFKIAFRSAFVFFKSYILKRGFLDGFEGLMVAMTVTNHVFYKYAKLFEANKRAMLGTRVVLARTDSLADVVLALPLAGYLKKVMPAIEITFIARQKYESVLARCVHVDYFLSYESVIENTQLLDAQKADTIIFINPEERLAKVAKAWGIRNRVATAHKLFNWRYCNHLVDFSRFKSNQHESQLNFQLLRPFYINRDLATNELAPLHGLQIDAEPVVFLEKDKFNLILHPVAGSEKDQGWPLINYLKLVELLPQDSFRVFITGTEEDGHRINKDLPQLTNHPLVTNLTGKQTLAELISFIGQADGFVSTHNGVLHLASVLNRLTIGIYTFKKPEHPSRKRPIGSRSTYLAVGQLCSACQNNQPCTCLANLDAETVKNKLLQSIQNKQTEVNSEKISDRTTSTPAAITQAKPKGISVVIPNYNGINLFPQTLPSLFKALATCGQPYEVIIVDDCSTDNSVNYLKENYPQISVLVNEVNKGFAPTINRGGFHAKHELLFLLNSDIKLEPNYFEPLLPYFDKPDTFGVMGRIINWDNDGIQDGAKFPTFRWAKIKTFTNYLQLQPEVKAGLYTMYLSGAEALVSKEKFLRLGGFDEIFTPYYIEDYELSLRAWRLGWNCYYEHSAVCRHKTSSSIKLKSKKKQIQTIYYRNKLFLHAIHLSKTQFKIYYVRVVLESLFRVLIFRFYYLRAIKLYSNEQYKCVESRQKFERLAMQVGTNLPIKAVVAKILRSLKNTRVERF